MPAQNFFTDATPKNWRDMLDCYDKVLEAKAATKSKNGASKELIELDKW